MISRVFNTVIFFFIFCIPLFSASNSFIDCRVATATANTDDINKMQVRGAFTVGNGAGVKMLYGYPGHPWSSFLSLYLESLNNTKTVYGLAGAWTSTPGDSPGNTMNTTSWKWNGINIKQQISIVSNPASGVNSDTLEFRYVVSNTNTFTARAGLRILFDTQLGTNDNSPVMVEGVGRVVQEAEWTGSAVPDAWFTVDNELNPTLRAEGNLSGGSAVKPDRLIIGQFDYMKPDVNRWTYAIHAQDITDTAVALFWDPQDYAAGQERVFVTYYGIPGITGSRMQAVKSASPSGMVNYGDTLSYSLIYHNTNTQYAANAYMWDTLPWNTSFVDAEPGYTLSGNVISWYLGNVNDTSGHTRWFTASVNEGRGVSVTNTSSLGYTDSYWNSGELEFSNPCSNPIATYSPTASPTQTPTFTISPTHTVSSTSTITPTSTPTPDPLTLSVYGVFPNPAKDTAHIVFNITCGAHVKVRLFTISGELVNQSRDYYEKGNNSFNWDLKNGNGKKVVSGTYLYTIEAVTERDEKKRLTGKFFVLR